MIGTDDSIEQWKINYLIKLEISFVMGTYVMWFTDFDRHMRQSISPRLAQGRYKPDTLIRNKIILFLLSTFKYLWGVYYSISLNSRVPNKNKRTPVSWKNIWRGDLDGIDFLIVRVFLWPEYYRFWSISTTKLKFF